MIRGITAQDRGASNPYCVLWSLAQAYKLPINTGLNCMAIMLMNTIIVHITCASSF